MLKLRSDRSLISQFNSNIQKQRSDSSLTCCLHVVCFYQVKLNLRSKRSVIFQFKKYWGIRCNMLQTLERRGYMK